MSSYAAAILRGGYWSGSTGAFLASAMVPAAARSYTAPVTQKRRDRDWTPGNPLRCKPQQPQRFCGFVVRASFFGGSGGEPRGSPVRASGFPVVQPVRVAASDWTRQRWFLKTEPAGRPPMAKSNRASVSPLRKASLSAVQLDDDFCNLKRALRAVTCLEGLLTPNWSAAPRPSTLPFVRCARPSSARCTERGVRQA